MQITKVQCGNYTAGRNGKKVIAIVEHITAGLMPGCLSWLCRPNGNSSAHYLVSKKGEIFQMVADENTAWHAGEVKKPNWILYDNTNPNRYTIGIEFECVSGGDLTEAQYQAGLWLHRQLLAKHNIPIDNNHIIGHYRIDTVNRPNDPGANFPWTRLFTDLKVPASVTIIAGSKTIPGQLIDSHTWGPIADICNAKGITYTWDGAKRIMALAGADTSNIPATTGVTIAAANQAIAGSIIDSKTWGPVGEILKALAIPYTWEAATRTLKF